MSDHLTVTLLKFNERTMNGNVYEFNDSIAESIEKLKLSEPIPVESSIPDLTNLTPEEKLKRVGQIDLSRAIGCIKNIRVSSDKKELLGDFKPFNNDFDKNILNNGFALRGFRNSERIVITTFDLRGGVS